MDISQAKPENTPYPKPEVSRTVPSRSLCVSVVKSSSKFAGWFSNPVCTLPTPANKSPWYDDAVDGSMAAAVVRGASDAVDCFSMVCCTVCSGPSSFVGNIEGSIAWSSGVSRVGLSRYPESEPELGKGIAEGIISYFKGGGGDLRGDLPRRGK